MKLKPLVIGDITAEVPVIQGGMGVGISLGSLAGAVAKEGGIGVISTAQIGYREPDFEKNPVAANLRAVGQEIKKARDIASRGILGVNIMVPTRYYEEYVKAAVAAGIDLIISGASLPTRLPEYVKQAKTKIAPIVSSIKSAAVICKYWDRKYQFAPDLVVIEGPKAGGHLGFSEAELASVDDQAYDQEIKGILKVVKDYADKYQKQIPVVIAGGIYDRADIDHSLSLGADGVQMGTRFVTTHECDADIRYKEAYMKAKKEDIVIVKSPVGLPGRAIYNAFLESVDKTGAKLPKCRQCLEKCDRTKIPYCISEALIQAVKGKVDKALLFCGANAYRADHLEHVADIFAEIAG